MTVRIRETDYVTASGDTYPVAPDAVRGHLMILASGGLMDQLEESFGDNPDPADANYSIVEYDPAPAPGTTTPADRVKSRLKELVDDSSDHQLVGVTAETVWSDGSTIEAQPAFALGDTLFYDTTTCDGRGRWIRGVAGDDECTTAVGILYHELAHGFLNHGAGEVATEEAEAIDEENDLRAAQNLVLRDRDRIEGGCDCPGGGCCIIATVSYNSPWAADVQRLRRLRDYTLRSSALGSELFEELHRQYYLFSIDVCRVMVQSREAHNHVSTGLVRPLIAVLSLFELCASKGSTAEAIGQFARDHGAFRGQELPPTQASGLLEAVAQGTVPAAVRGSVDPSTGEVLSILAQRLPETPHVKWGIVLPLLIWLRVGARFSDEHDPAVVGSWILSEYSKWIAEVPISPKWLGTECDAGFPEAVVEFAATVAGSEERRRALERAVAERRRDVSGVWA